MFLFQGIGGLAGGIFVQIVPLFTREITPYELSGNMGGLYKTIF